MDVFDALYLLRLLGSARRGKADQSQEKQHFSAPYKSGKPLKFLKVSLKDPGLVHKEYEKVRKNTKLGTETSFRKGTLELWKIQENCISLKCLRNKFKGL